jgi:hypothetical protein
MFYGRQEVVEVLIARPSWLTAGMIEATIRADELALSALEDRSTVDTVLPVVKVLVLMRHHVRLWKLIR